MSNVSNYQVGLDVMGWMQPLRKYFAEGQEGDRIFAGLTNANILIGEDGKLHITPRFVEEEWPKVVEVMENKPQSCRLVLMKFTDGWYAAFCPWDEKLMDMDVEDIDWQATQFETPGEAVCHAALRSCQS